MSEPTIGHNSEAEAPSTSFSKDQLRTVIERIERLEEEKATISSDVRDIYAEAKGNGFCSKTLRKVVALRKKDANDRAEEAAILDLYMHAMGME